MRKFLPEAASGRQDGAKPDMLFGHNTNVKVGDTTYHVQTEDRGASSALIETTVHYHGRVLHKRTNNYLDLLPLDADRERALKLRVDDQHRTVVESIRNGTLSLTIPPEQKAPATASLAAPAGPLHLKGSSPAPHPAAAALRLELINPRTWLNGKKALLQVAIRDAEGNPADGAIVTAKVEGAAKPSEFSTVTGGSGNAQLDFEMPPLSGSDAALVVDAFKGSAKGQLRFQLRTKPRVPSASQNR